MNNAGNTKLALAPTVAVAAVATTVVASPAARRRCRAQAARHMVRMSRPVLCQIDTDWLRALAGAAMSLAGEALMSGDRLAAIQTMEWSAAAFDLTIPDDDISHA